jgi:transposase-like protein
VFPKTKCQRDWSHKVSNVLDALPKSVHPLAKKMPAEVRDAEDRDHAVEAAKAFDAEFRPAGPRLPAR